MLNLKNRSPLKELLDAEVIPFEDIQQNLIELNAINSLLGGHKITLDGIKIFIPKIKNSLHIVEIGCGGGDNLHVIQKYLTRKNITHKLCGVDIKQECIDYAKKQYPEIEFICSDYRDMHFDVKPDVVFNSLFCHHFNDEQLVHILKWMKENSSIGFFINDLQRHWIAYYSIKFITNLFSKSYLVKNDAPLSVARSFRKKEWEKICEQANIRQYQLQWKWAFRYLLHTSV